MFAIRFLTLITLSSIITSCEEKTVKENLIPKEFQYPIENIGVGKTFHYNRAGGIHEHSFTNIKAIKEDGKDYLTYAYYTNNSKTDSIKTNLAGKLIEAYNFDLINKTEWDYFKGIKATIVSDTIIDDGSKFGKRSSIILYNGKKRSVKVNEETKYLYDTIIDENGLPLKCFVTEKISNIEYKDKEKKLATEIVKRKSYYAKDRGLFCYSIEKKGDSSMWFEMNIEDKEK